jgi:hypothetical protein
MDSHRLTRFLPAARTAAIASSLATVAMFLLPNAAFAATPIGSPVGNTSCVAGYDVVQASSSGPSYTVPAGGGSITSWSTMAGGPGFLGPARLEVWRPKTAGVYTLVGISAPEALTARILNTFPVNIGVQAGDLLGLNVVDQMLCLQTTTAAAGFVGFSYDPIPVAGTDKAMTVPTLPFELNVAAMVTASTPVSRGCNESGDGSRNARCREKEKDKDKVKVKDKDKAKDHE